MDTVELKCIIVDSTVILSSGCIIPDQIYEKYHIFSYAPYWARGCGTNSPETARKTNRVFGEGLISHSTVSF